ncbi:MAG: hypothetical protein JRC92_12000, partial [Deltaproteobacteria bacterium]|nr:hypothetical protein [Deltaproteobacteria bacterium]
EHLAEKTADLERRLVLDGDRLSGEEVRITELAEEAEELGRRGQAVEGEYQKHDFAAEELAKGLDSAQESATNKMRAVAQVRERLVDLISRRAQADNAVASAQQRLDSLAAHRKRQAEQAAQAGSDKARLAESLKEGRQDLSRADEERERLKAEQLSLEERLGQAQEELSLREPVLEEAREERRRLAGQLEGLEALAESYEGVAEGVKALLTDAELAESLGPQPFLGLIAEGIRAEPEIEPAVEAALAGGVEFLAVRDGQALRAALERLAAGSSGRADLLTETLLSPSTPSAPPPAGARVLAEHLDFTGPVGPLARALVGDTLLADDLATALEVWQADGRRRPVVTPRGESIRPPGVVSGGRPPKAQASLLARRRRIKELKERLGRAEKREAEAAGRQESAKKLAAAIKEEEQTLAGRMREAEGVVVEAEKEVATLTVRLDEIARLEEVLAAEAEQTLAERAEMEETIERQSELLNRFEDEQAEVDEALSQAEDQAEEASQAAASLREELSELKVALTRLGQDKEELDRMSRRLQAESQRTGERIAALKEELIRAEEEKKALASRRAANEEELRGLTVSVRQQEQKIGREDERLAIYQQELSERAASLKEARQELRRAEDEAQEANLALSETRLSLQHLAAGVQERLQVDLAAEPEEHLQRELDESAAADELAELRAKVERMGQVNPTAVEEFKALE